MMNTQATPTRDRVLAIIKREGDVTVKQLTIELDITPMAIRGHLNKLERDQFIKVGNVKQKLGRPLQIFSLTEKGDTCFPKNYGQFSVSLLESLKEINDGQILNQVIEKREEKLIRERTKFLEKATTPHEKLELYAKCLDRMGYMPTVEKVSEVKYLFHENNCALRDIANNFNFCCSSELKILCAIFPEAKVTRVANQAHKDTRCTYQFDF